MGCDIHVSGIEMYSLTFTLHSGSSEKAVSEYCEAKLPGHAASVQYKLAEVYHTESIFEKASNAYEKASSLFLAAAKQKQAVQCQIQAGNLSVSLKKASEIFQNILLNPTNQHETSGTTEVFNNPEIMLKTGLCIMADEFATESTFDETIANFVEHDVICAASKEYIFLQRLRKLRYNRNRASEEDILNLIHDFTDEVFYFDCATGDAGLCCWKLKILMDIKSALSKTLQTV